MVGSVWQRGWKVTVVVVVVNTGIIGILVN